MPRCSALLGASRNAFRAVHSLASLAISLRGRPRSPIRAEPNTGPLRRTDLGPKMVAATYQWSTGPPSQTDLGMKTVVAAHQWSTGPPSRTDSGRSRVLVEHWSVVRDEFEPENGRFRVPVATGPPSRTDSSRIHAPVAEWPTGTSPALEDWGVPDAWRHSHKQYTPQGKRYRRCKGNEPDGLTDVFLQRGGQLAR